MVRVALVLALVPVASLAGAASGDGSQEGLVKLGSFSADRGRFDHVFDLSEDGRLLAVVETNGQLARIRVRDVTTGAERVPLNISALTVKPLSLQFASSGRLLVVWRDPKGSAQLGALLGPNHAPQHFGPAQSITIAKRSGSGIVVVRKLETVAGEQARRQLVVELYDSKTGQAIGSSRVFPLDGGKGGELPHFQPEYWRDQGLTVVGTREGHYDPKLDQKLPDYEAWYSFVKGDFIVRREIRRPIQHRKDLQLMAKHTGQGRFVAPYWDMSKLLTVVDGVVADLGIGVDLRNYDRRTLKSQPLPSSTVFSMLTDRLSATGRPQPRYFELFRVEESSRKASRLARLRKRDRRDWAWRTSGQTLAIMIRGIGRGGKRIDLYRLARPPR